MSTGVEQQRDRSDSFNQRKEIVQNLENEKQFNPRKLTKLQNQ